MENNNIYEIENLNKGNELKQQEILERYPKYLPLGSIVILKKGWKKIMIMGFLPIDMDSKEEIYDYLGCLYPEGIVRTDINILFNHEDIKQIIAIGLKDQEQEEFMKDLTLNIDDEGVKKEILDKVKRK